MWNWQGRLTEALRLGPAFQGSVGLHLNLGSGLLGLVRAAAAVVVVYSVRDSVPVVAAVAVAVVAAAVVVVAAVAAAVVAAAVVAAAAAAAVVAAAAAADVAVVVVAAADVAVVAAAAVDAVVEGATVPDNAARALEMVTQLEQLHLLSQLEGNSSGVHTAWRRYFRRVPALDDRGW